MAAAALATAGCLDLATSACEDGLLCPAGTQCFGGTCVLPDQLSACEGLPDGAACSYPTIEEGVCTGSVCVPAGCGNGLVEVERGEVCDDGNLEGGDGCSADCRSDEQCGNGIIDLLADEACDCGDSQRNLRDGCERINGNEDGAICTAQCKLHGCGDGIRRAPEQCDGADMGPGTCEEFGFYSGSIACNDNCAYDLSACGGRCGDGVLNGPELCEPGIRSAEVCLDFGFDYGLPQCSAAVCTPTFTSCRNFGWKPVYSADFTGRAITGTDSGEMFVSGSDGVILHYDGETWQPMDSGSTARLEDIYAIADDDVFSVGASGTILHYDGQSWSPMTAGVNDSFTGVWGSSGDDVWVTGQQATLLHYDGSAWTQVDPGTDVWLSEVWGLAQDDVYIAGYDGQVLHYDGTSWSPMDTGSNASLNFVWGTSPTDIYATGFPGALLEYDGDTWSSIDTSSVQALWSVGGTAEDIFAAGEYVVYKRGNSWSDVALSVDEIIELWQAPSGLHAIGSRGNVLRFEGIEWAPGQIDDNLYWATWGTGPGNVYAVGDGGVIARYRSGGWQPMVSGTDVFLYDVWGTGSANVFAVGGDGTVLHFDGNAWSQQASPTGQSLRGISGTPEGPIFAVGQDGTILRRSDDVWTLVGSGTAQTLNDVWVLGPDDAVAVGTETTILQFDGTVWTKVEQEDTRSLFSVWSDGDIVYAAGAAGLLLRRQDGQWESVTSGTSDDLRAIGGTSTEDIFISGGSGTLLIEDGNGLGPARVPFDELIEGIWADEAAIFFVGQAGSAWRLIRTP